MEYSTTIVYQVRRALAIALVFQVAWLVTGLIFMLVDAPVLWVLLIANLFTLWVPALFILVTRSSLPESFQIGFAVFITSSSLLGSSLDVYGAFLSWDTIVHVYSGVLLAWFGFILVGKVRVPKGVSLPLWFKNTVAFMTPLAFAVAWEVYEYVSDNLFGTSMQAGGLEDTIVDMAAALVGAGIAVLVSVVWSLYAKRRA